MPAFPDAAPFQAARPLLFSIAYRMLGSAAEAEDVVQDAYLRYADAPQAVVVPVDDAPNGGSLGS